jgi:hypothetical protein
MSGFPFRTPAFCSVFQGTKTARREGISSPFSDAGGCTSPQNSGTGKITVDELVSAKHEGHTFVLDASIAACWAFDDEDHPVAALALERVRTDEARVPSLWWFEVRNTLIVSERRGRLTESDTATFLHGLARLCPSRLIGRRRRPTFLRLPAIAALQSMTPHILS